MEAETIDRMTWNDDRKLMLEADADRQSNWRGVMRWARRVARRCWRDSSNWNQPRVFCQNSGACGSSYIVQLLVDNGFSQAFHERQPDLLHMGLEHYEGQVSRSRLIRILRYTRHDVRFEANNRLFSLSRELSDAFPNARFIHLLRHPAAAVRSAMSRPGVEPYLATSHRFRGTLAGPKSAAPFERFCWHWANMNGRIADDLKAVSERTGRTALILKFEDLIAGRIDHLEDFLQTPLPIRQRPPVNQSPTRSEGKFPPFAQWSSRQRQQFERICMPVYDRILNGITPNAVRAA